MRRRLRLSVLAAAILLVALGALLSDTDRELTRTTFGTVPDGYSALFHLLDELRFPVARIYDVAALPPGATVWWIEPWGICRGTGAPNAGSDWAGERWMRAGGTGVVFLSPPRAGGDRSCESIAGLPVPARVLAGARDGASAAGGHLVTGPIAPVPRWLESDSLGVFAQSGLGSAIAFAGEQPFAVEYPLGNGRLILVADSSFLRNRRLDRADAAPFAVDLVQAFGSPRIDEAEHGMGVERSAARYLLTSPAAPLLAGLAVLGLLLFWHGALMPPATLPAGEAEAPALAAFVDSLASLYARTGDHARLLEQYRLRVAGRLRRHLHLPPEAALALLLDRVRARSNASAEQLRLLGEGRPVRSEAELRAAARSLDELEREVGS